MDTAEREFQRAFYQAVADRPLDAGHSFYVPIYERGGTAEDPIALLQQQIELRGGDTSAHLVSGYRGSGKSTELRRLAALLEDQGFIVVLVDIEQYVNTGVPTDISDLLLVLAGALGDTLRARFGDEVVDESYWERLVGFLGRVHFSLDEITAGFSGGGASVAVKASLKADPSFQRRLQEHLASHVGALVDDIRDHVRDLIDRVETAHDGGSPAAGVVLIVDSIEHFRDAVVTEGSVQNSLKVVFSQHADRLRLPAVHSIYTIPPFVRVQAKAELTDRYDGEAIMLRAVRVEHRGAGGPCSEGQDTLVEVISRRGDWERVFASRDLLDKVIAASGGHLRDFLRLVQAVLARATAFPVDEHVVERSIRQLRGELLPIALDDAKWLARVAETGEAGLASMRDLNRLAQFLDSHLLLAYQDTEEWYNVHPLVRDRVRELAAQNDDIVR